MCSLTLLDWLRQRASEQASKQEKILCALPGYCVSSSNLVQSILYISHSLNINAECNFQVNVHFQHIRLVGVVLLAARREKFSHFHLQNDQFEQFFCIPLEHYSFLKLSYYLIRHNKFISHRTATMQSPTTPRELRLQNRSKSNTPSNDVPVNFEIPSGQPDNLFTLLQGLTTPKSNSSNFQRHQQQASRILRSGTSPKVGAPTPIPSVPQSRGQRTLLLAQQQKQQHRDSDKITTKQKQQLTNSEKRSIENENENNRKKAHTQPRRAHTALAAENKEDEYSDGGVNHREETSYQKEKKEEEEDVEEEKKEEEEEDESEGDGRETHHPQEEEEKKEEEEEDESEGDGRENNHDDDENLSHDDKGEDEEEGKEVDEDGDYGDHGDDEYHEEEDEDGREEEEEEDDEEDEEEDEEEDSRRSQNRQRQRKTHQSKQNNDQLVCCRQMIFKLKYGHVWVHDFRRRLLNAGRRFLTSIHFLCIMPLTNGTSTRPVQMSCRVCTTKTVYYCVGCSSGMEEHLADDHHHGYDISASFTKNSPVQYGCNSKGKPFTRNERLLLVRRNEIIPICLGNNGACFQFYHQGIQSPIRHPLTFSQEEYDYMTKHYGDLCYPISTSGNRIDNDGRRRRRRNSSTT